MTTDTPAMPTGPNRCEHCVPGDGAWVHVNPANTAPCANRITVDTVVAERPYLGAGEFAYGDQGVTIVYVYAHGGDERAIIASVQQGRCEPPLRWIRAWIRDWERILDAPSLAISSQGDLPELTLTGHLGATTVVVRAVPAKMPHEQAARVHPVVARLRAAREARGRTAEEVARTLGYTPTSLSRWEHGDAVPSLVQAEDLAQVLGYRITLTGQRPRTTPGEST